MHWSGTGNAENMVRLIKNGLAETEVVSVSDVIIDEILKDEILVLGCSSIGY